MWNSNRSTPKWLHIAVEYLSQCIGLFEFTCFHIKEPSGTREAKGEWEESRIDSFPRLLPFNDSIPLLPTGATEETTVNAYLNSIDFVGAK
jgi:hypothetical protein